jgi:hypothetical protein
MTEQQGLSDLPDPLPTAPTNAAQDRGRRGEHWTRTTVADGHVVDSTTLREAAHRRLSDSITIDLVPAGSTDDDPDLLDPHEESTTSDAAAVRWWIEPTGIWPQPADTLRLDAVDLDAADKGAQLVRARWRVTVTITDMHLLCGCTASTGLPDDTFAELWNGAADPFAPLTDLPGATWTWVPQLTCDLVHDRESRCRSGWCDLVRHGESPSNTTRPGMVL